MTDPALSLLEATQAQAPSQNGLTSQIAAMYEQYPRVICPPAAFSSSFISKSIADVDSDFYHQKEPGKAFRWSDDSLRNLQRSYAFISNSVQIGNVLERVPGLYPLLQAAIEPLDFAFGESKLLQLEALASDDDNILRVIVKLPQEIENAAALMHKFKLDWWLKHCSGSEAALVFDYETGNGF